MKASTLKYHHEREHPKSLFFARESMKFFGDTMKNFGVRKVQRYYELYRRKPVRNGHQTSSWFSMKNFERVHVPEWKCERCGKKYKDYACSTPNRFGGLILCDGCFPMKADESKERQGDKDGVCPKCGKTSLDYGNTEIDGEYIFYEWTCADCGADGRSDYKMVFEGHTVDGESGHA